MTQKFFNQELAGPGEAPLHCEPGSTRPSCASISPRRPCGAFFNCRICWAWTENCAAKDVDAERINVPANPKNYWRYRMHLTLEKLQQAEAFNDGLNKSIRAAGR